MIDSESAIALLPIAKWQMMAIIVLLSTAQPQYTIADPSPNQGSSPVPKTFNYRLHHLAHPPRLGPQRLDERPQLAPLAAPRPMHRPSCPQPLQPLGRPRPRAEAAVEAAPAVQHGDVPALAALPRASAAEP